MITFTQIGDQVFAGTLIRESRTHPVYGNGFFSYLSARLPERWVHVEKWDFDGSETSEPALRSALVHAIERPAA